MINALVERIHSLNRGHEAITVIRGTSNQEQIMVDLYKTASELVNAQSTGLVEEQLGKIESALYIAQATNAIGSKDLDELLEMISKIRETKD